jgi:hypothetical protein
MPSEQDFKHIHEKTFTNGKSYMFDQLYVRVGILNVECTCVTASYHGEEEGFGHIKLV